MDLFSLVSPENDSIIPENPGEEDDSFEQHFSQHDINNDGFETPRSNEWTPTSTPRSLFSTPPRSPPKTPLRPTSHVDDRIRMRRYKLSISPSSSPVKLPSSGGDLLSEQPVEDSPLLSHRATDISFSTAREDDGRNNESPRYDDHSSSFSNATPNSSPRKHNFDQLSLSPLQQRLARARIKRQQIQEERVQNIDNKSKAKEQQATKRKEDATFENLSKANRTLESILQAKSKRQQLLEERVHQIEIKSKLKEKEASRRKEDVILSTITKAQAELAKSPLAKERRDQQLALRLEELETTLENKNLSAQRRLERHLFEKQQRASCHERKERAKRRRTLISYEKRAKLLAALDAKLERAALKSREFVEEKAIRAAEDIRNAKEVSRRVRAARVIQGAVRDAYGLDYPDNRGHSSLGQHDAAERLQRSFWWRARICKRRFSGRCEGDGNDESDASISKAGAAIEALEKLLNMFPAEVPLPGGEKQQQNHRPSKGHPSPPLFEELGQQMMKPDTLKMALLIVECLRPINELSFGSSSSDGGHGSAASGPSSAKFSPKIDGRTLLSLSLIAVYPREVLGDDFDKPTSSSGDVKDDRSSRGSKRLALTCRSLLSSMKHLLVVIKTETSDIDAEQIQILKLTSSLILQASTLFLWWKGKDMEQLLGGLRKQLGQSWAVYLTASDTLKYLAEVTGSPDHVAVAKKGSGGGTVGANKRDDPLMSLRIRHEASRAGSRSHIKRIRLSLDKLIGPDEGREIVKNAKSVALKDIRENNTMKDLKGEVDEIYGGLGSNLMPSSVPSEDNSAIANVSEETSNDVGRQGAAMEGQSVMSADLPDEILSNRTLVHKILLTDPSDFHTLSWDGMNAESSNVIPEEFMASFVSQPTVSHDQNNGGEGSLENIPISIAQSTRKAFFDQIAQDMSRGNYESVRELMKELHTKMRSLLPSRKDLHSHINDEDVSSVSSTSDILRGLIRSGYLLSTYLESAARAPTTREIIECAEAFNSHPRDGDTLMIPYGIDSEELFAVASIAFTLHKAELCQMDVSNYKLSQAAPLIHHVGHEYERKNFQRMHGDYSSSSIADLQHMLPSTWNWLNQMQTLFGNSENLTTQPNLEQQMDFVKGKGFVDGILFTRSQLALPEFLSLDVDSINHIRSEARCCVIASALALHACNISKVGTSLLSSSVTSDEIIHARQVLASALRRKHFEQADLESNIIEAIGTLAKALAERDLAAEEYGILKSHTLAVLRGNDPVLKLLDNRVQSFFRFACKWKPEHTLFGISAPLEMKTGRSIMKTEDDASLSHGIKSTKEEFLLAAKREASRLGFAYFGSELIEVGNEARCVISLACTNYARDILDRFLGVTTEGN